MCMVWANRWKELVVEGNAVVSGEWWSVPSWVELCILCRMQMSSVRG